MAEITITARNPWRQDLLPASFSGAAFHVAAATVEGGERVVVHEFPKKDWPYTERMGRRAIEFSVRGYIVQYPHNEQSPLYRRDYRLARDRLREVLDRGLAGALLLPTLPYMTVICSRYRMTEEERFGGYVTFDMTFNEQGSSELSYRTEDTVAIIDENYNSFRRETLLKLLPNDLSNQQIQEIVAGVEAGNSEQLQKAWDKIKADLIQGQDLQ